MPEPKRRRVVVAGQTATFQHAGDEAGLHERDVAIEDDDLDRVGYEGYVGLEYRPLADTASSLQWLRAYRAGMK